MRSRWIALALMICPEAAVAQQQSASLPQAPPPPDSKITIRAEKKVVLVDAVVTDKKGEYVKDLTADDFRVWEDKKEQEIESFSFESRPSSPSKDVKHYIVLFFDNAGMQLTDQMQARRAAGKFLDSNTGPNRYIAVVNFSGSLQVAQNFTTDADTLHQAVAGTKFSSVSTSELASLAPLSRAASDFGARDVLLALRSLAKNLAPVPGRKTLIFLSAGFKLDLELRSELTATIDICNKSNVAVYPIDVRGLVAAGNRLPGGDSWLRQVGFFQIRGGGGGVVGGGGRPGGTTGGTSGGGTRSGNTGSTTSGGGGRTGGTTGGTSGGGTRTGNTGGYNNYGPYVNNPFNQPRVIIPHIPDVMSQQEVLYDLAAGTGGFVIVNTNDLVAGLQKIGNEVDEYYLIGYSPAEESKEGACHELKVKVGRGGLNVRSRTGYCTAKPLDALAGTSEEQTLEARAAAMGAGNVAASVELPFFYVSPNTARVNVAMEIPSNSLKFEKQKGKMRASVNVLGIAYDPQGAVAAKFSDSMDLALENKKAVEEFQQKPLHYETQFNIASGKYNLKVVFSSGGESFGKLEVPLAIDAYDAKKFSLSGVALSKDIHRVSDLDVGLDAALLEDKTPLVTQGLQLNPSGSNLFRKAEAAALYVEVYEPAMTNENAPKVGVEMRIVDKKTGEKKFDSGFMNAAEYVKSGSPVIPVGLKLPVDTLIPGAYRVEVMAIDTSHNQSPLRTADFEVLN